MMSQTACEAIGLTDFGAIQLCEPVGLLHDSIGIPGFGHIDGLWGPSEGGLFLWRPMFVGK